MLRQWLVLAGLIVGSAAAAAQGPDQEVRKALEDANLAARKADKAAYTRFLADDLRWVRNDGGIDGKQQRLAGLGQGNTPTISDIDAKLVGDVAIVTVTLTGQNGSKSRGARVLVKRDGRWQLVLHSQIPITTK